MDSLEQSLAKLKEAMANQMKTEVGVVEERFTCKQDKTNQILAVLLKGQARLFQRGEKEEPTCRRRATQDMETHLNETDRGWPNHRSQRENEREPSVEDDASGGGRSSWRRRKLDIPSSCGEDPDSWI